MLDTICLYLYMKCGCLNKISNKALTVSVLFIELNKGDLNCLPGLMGAPQGK